MKRRLLSLLLLCCFSMRALADGLPDLGDSAQADISPQMERQIGLSIERSIRFEEPSYLNDPEIEDYLDRIGSRLVAASQSPSQSFHFFVLQDKAINAASMLGGVLVFNTGLFLAAESESELASVMAHEISHVQQRHQARMIAQQSSMTTMMIASVLLAILAARSSGDAAQAAIFGGQAGISALQLGYSRDYEREADRIGLQMLGAAGFDTRAMVSFFEKLDRSSRLFDNPVYKYLRTHPMTSERISDMANRVQQTPYHQVLDSVDFVLVRAKIEALEGVPQDVLARFSGEPAQRPLAAAAHWYARARAHLRLKEVGEARRDFDALKRLPLTSPMIDLLGADIQRATNEPTAAAATLRSSLFRYPGSRALRYAESDALIAAGQPAEASRLASEAARLYPTDDRAYTLIARAAAARGLRLAQHRAQAEVYYLQGSLGAAAEQLQLGLRAGDGDYFEKTAAEARLAELRQMRREQQRDSRR
ncbi:M48 family metalloprotease [Niveibacterium terrae]|uniref:M48 family metallopeptidase n=1 Tax=Niveibacterium terrae TaxID=3373598 RepID=UPI003A932E76